MNHLFQSHLCALLLTVGISAFAQTNSGPSAKPDEVIVKEYRALMSEYQSVQAAWKDAPKAERDEALKAWQESNGSKLRDLQQKARPQTVGMTMAPLSRPIPENIPPAQRAYLEALRDYQKSLKLERTKEPPEPLNAETKAKHEEQKANLNKLAEAAKAEREEIESTLPEPERRKIELRRAALQKEKAEREAFFQSLKTLTALERQAALKKWSEERRAARETITDK